MALIKLHSNIKYLNRIYSLSSRTSSNYTPEEIPSEIFALREKDNPVNIPNPFEKPKPLCILCKHKIKPDYKNVRLLSQFVSPYTGQIYGRHITALCEKKQLLVEVAILQSRKAGLMAYYLKDPIYFNDPKLYDPENPIKPHKY